MNPGGVRPTTAVHYFHAFPKMAVLPCRSGVRRGKFQVHSFPNTKLFEPENLAI